MSERRSRILVVDDQPANAILLAFVLSSAGHEVRTADRAAAALACIAEWSPDLVLMDLQLPGIDGFELTARLRRDPTTRDLPIIAVTAYAMKGDEARALDAGCDGYLSKPIDTRTLAKTVAEHLERREPKAMT
jgi:two-component system cell cycle response regulator DivK